MGLTAAAEAVAARVLKDTDLVLAPRSLELARADWDAALARTTNADVELMTALVIAGTELFRVTGEQVYANKVGECALHLIASQQQERPSWDVPLAGFLYTNTNRHRILHPSELAHYESPSVALAALCSTFPQHADWMKWYAAATLHAEYLRATTRFTAPYGMLPASIYQVDETESSPDVLGQIKSGVKLDAGHFLRLFPVRSTARGHFPTLLFEAQTLAVVGHLRRDLGLIRHAEQQLQWVVGRNPFNQSTMVGEGREFPTLRPVLSGTVVGALAAGFTTRGKEDRPYWPSDTRSPAKEVSLTAATGWLALMRDLAGPATVVGEVTNRE